MNPSPDSPVQWRYVATVEVDASIVDLPELVRDERFTFRLKAAAVSPSGYRWFELFVDPQKGERRAAFTTFTILKAMERAASAGALNNFRIVHGQQWLELVSPGHPLGFET